MELSIIIVNFNTRQLLFNCLKSIFTETKNISYEVIIVDNGSTDDSLSFVKKHFPQVKIITNKKNLGFAKASNQGVTIAKGKYLLFLNSDTLILNKAIEKSLKFIIKNPQINILGCRLLNKDRSIQPSIGFFPQLKQLFLMMFFLDDIPFINRLMKPYQQSRIDFYCKTQEVDWVTGAFLLLSKKVINKIGGFDEDFFMYNEEVDFCYRAKKEGFKVWFYHEPEIIHLKGKSSQEGFKTAVLGEYQGLEKFYKKYQSSLANQQLRFLLKFGALLRIVVFGILKQDKYKQKTYEEAFKLV